MATKAIKGYRINEAGALIKKAPRMTGPLRKRIEGKAARLTKAWKAKSK